MAKRKPPPLGPIERGGVALPYLNRGIRMTIHDPKLVAAVAAALRKLPSCPAQRPGMIALALSSLAAKLSPFDPDADDPIEWIGAELTRSIQAGLLMDQVPEYDRLTDKQKLAQLDALDASIAQLDEVFGQLRHESWEEVRSVRPDLPPELTIARDGIYYLWRDEKDDHGIHCTKRSERRAAGCKTAPQTGVRDQMGLPPGQRARPGKSTSGLQARSLGSIGTTPPANTRASS